MNRVYEEVVEESKVMSEKYFREVQRGANKVSFMKWNNIVLKELAIDNVSIFGLTNGIEE